MKIDQVHPRCDMVLVRRVPDEEVLPSGLFVPQMARDRKTGVRIGEVLRVGPGDSIKVDCTICYRTGLNHDEACPLWGRELTEIRFPLDTKVGDRILYERCPDNDVMVYGVPCVLLREEQHVLAILGAA